MNKSKKEADLLFIISFWGSIFLGVTLSGYIIVDNHLSLCLSLECINNFTDIFLLPIKIVSAGMALSAFRMLIVKSDQSQKQIDLAIEQNYFRNLCGLPLCQQQICFIKELNAHLCTSSIESS